MTAGCLPKNKPSHNVSCPVIYADYFVKLGVDSRLAPSYIILHKPVIHVADKYRDLAYDSFIFGSVSSVYTDGVYRAYISGGLLEIWRFAVSKTCHRQCSLYCTGRGQKFLLIWFRGIYRVHRSEATYYPFACFNTYPILYV